METLSRLHAHRVAGPWLAWGFQSSSHHLHRGEGCDTGYLSRARRSGCWCWEPWPTRSPAPTDQLKPEIDRVIAAIENTALQAGSRAADRRQVVRAITDRIFDWTEMSRQALGRHWKARTADEREEFIPLFRELLERAFLGKIEQYGAENVAYTEEAMDGDDTIVRTRVTLKPNWEVGVDYRMAWQGSRWMISVVLVEHTSLVRNFRSQFDSVIKRSSYEDLVTKIRARLP